MDWGWSLHSRKLHIAAIFAAGVFGAAWIAGPAALRSDEPSTELVGVIDGESIAVEGPMKVEVVRNEVRTTLRSGSDVRVKAGGARVDLVEGGSLAICGPAHFSVLKSHGSLTVALDSGVIRLRLGKEPAVTVYTPQIQAKPIAIGDGPQDLAVGLDPGGTMCLRANLGAIRLEQQLTGQTLIVPQSANVALNDGQIDSLRPGGAHCICEPPAHKVPPPELSTVASTEEVRARKATAPKSEPPAPKEEPIYKVYMPPLAYDAAAKVQPEPDPRLIVLARRVRVRPTLIYQGRVEGEAVAAAVPAPVPAPAPRAAQPQNTAPPEGVMGRLKSFIRRLWNGS